MARVVAVIMALVISYNLIAMRGAPAAQDSQAAKDFDEKP